MCVLHHMMGSQMCELCVMGEKFCPVVLDLLWFVHTCSTCRQKFSFGNDRIVLLPQHFQWSQFTHKYLGSNKRFCGTLKANVCVIIGSFVGQGILLGINKICFQGNAFHIDMLKSYYWGFEPKLSCKEAHSTEIGETDFWAGGGGELVEDCAVWCCVMRLKSASILKYQ